MLAKGDTTISAKASNLTSLDFDETAQKHEVGIFWPKASSSQRESIVCPIKDWPSDYNRETQFLRRNLKWTDPQILGGVEGPGDAKPNYMMYYDANDVKSFPNQFANAVSFPLSTWVPKKIFCKIVVARFFPIFPSHRSQLGYRATNTIRSPVLVGAGTTEARASLSIPP